MQLDNPIYRWTDGEAYCKYTHWLSYFRQYFVAILSCVFLGILYRISLLRFYWYDRRHRCQKTNSTSQFGSQLDTIADLIFVVAAMIKLLPAIHLPGWLWIWGGCIAIIKVTNIVWGVVYRKKLVDVHTVLNKTTGLLLFLLPFTLQSVEPTYSFAVVCIIATIAAFQEGYHTIKTNNE